MKSLLSVSLEFSEVSLHLLPIKSAALGVSQCKESIVKNEKKRNNGNFWKGLIRITVRERMYVRVCP